MSLNLLLIGDSSCGKSHFASLITRRGYLKYIETADDTYVSFYQKIERTKGCDFRTAVREQFKLSIYELSGDKNQRKYLDIYMSQKHELIDGIIYCFDVNNLKTLENLRKWIRFLMKQENQQNAHNKDDLVVSEDNEDYYKYQNYQGISQDELKKLPILLIGWKCDMIVDKPVLRKNIEHEIEPLFDCDKGDNLFLLSYFQLKFDHSEFQRLEQGLIKVFEGKRRVRKPYIVNEVNHILLFDNYSYFSGIFRNLHLMKIQLKHIIKRLSCKKLKN